MGRESNKGNIANLTPFNTLPAERVREIQSKGGKVAQERYKQRKSICEALRTILEEPLSPESDKTKMDGIAMKAIKKMFDDPDIRDVKVLAEILGEVKQTIDPVGLSVNITATESGRDNITKILADEE